MASKTANFLTEKTIEGIRSLRGAQRADFLTTFQSDIESHVHFIDNDDDDEATQFIESLCSVLDSNPEFISSLVGYPDDELEEYFISLLEDFMIEEDDY